MFKKLFPLFVIVSLFVAGCLPGSPASGSAAATSAAPAGTVAEAPKEVICPPSDLGKLMIFNNEQYVCVLAAGVTDDSTVDDSTTTGTTCVEDPLAVTSFTDREVATVNGDPVDIQVRGNCPQPVYYDTTGIPDPNDPGSGGQNYDLHLPVGWTAMTASTTAEIHPNGGTAQQFLECPNIVITGPFDGGVGLYEGAIRIFPTEWIQGMIDWINPIQDAQCKFDVPVTFFQP